MSGFDSLKQFFRPTDTTFVLAGDPFVAIDREKAIDRLKLDDRAADNGKNEQPPADSTAFDNVEADIVAEISEYANRAHSNAQANYRVYGKRLSELALLRELSTVTGASEQAIGDYRTTIIKSQGRLSLARDSIKESYEELAQFKLDHGLKRTAHKGLNPLYAWPTIIVALAIESIANTFFLRVNDDMGVAGGFVAALVVAAINIGSSFGAGKYWWPYLFHKSPEKKWLAVGGCIAWGAFAVFWNLLAAHFREVKALGLDSPETAAWTMFFQHPFGLSSIYSAGLLVVGLIFAITSALTAFKMDDPYPHYGQIYRRHEARCEEYADEVDGTLEDLADIRDDAVKTATEVKSLLGAQFRERGQILSNREALRSSFAQHQVYLEETANALLDHYRTANRRARSTEPPNHFNDRWKLERAELPVPEPQPSIDDEVQRAQSSLDGSIRDVTAAYNSAIEQVQHLDSVKELHRHG